MKPYSDEYFMKLALKEGYKGLGKTSPNPPVGAVLVDPKTLKVIAKGYHRGYGLSHAEVEAIKKAKDKAKGAILYVTLEPCNHYGKTPPCTKKILEAEISKVICGLRDPNPLARGGLETLKKHGIDVKSGVLEREVKILTRFFLSRILRKSPWIIVKIASSIDGKIAVSTGDSKWITDFKARKEAHKIRSMVDAILVGKNTVLKDDPELTTRLIKGKSPLRIVLDTNLTLSPNFRVFRVDETQKTILVCGEKTFLLEKEEVFKKRGVEVWKLPLKEEKIDLKALIERCYQENITSLLVEGGAEVIGSFISEGLVDEVFYFIGPMIIGDREGIPAVKGKPLQSLKEALLLHEISLKKLENTFLFHAYTSKGLELLNT
ncbi:MAG: bifunctional diaminohydroxyphosphoribosylaminopyrimidine deaminase/5-amino-6-(5-phosphoribosylamino)uracil reductase RibD [Thermodesulfobacteriaceae bacterium]|nr:bifunctional diaminohydroxyphosphoribosylaminopyrimidine deaminase/5-amino-6-(5-phosphoribosylamino)uracil reductase RibD [Thermodesulfobacteriaceae bacterium]MCX8042251.1 bifunctional diaminohydroxyphosphoribosylaminopyrimidine deaminase/5-amino-6-(5-phosphoribosylamino)uracil reductase RibD [Thermodesulfobacteriaceae bacterium]MDW8136544.1 bifunctional diaminohydroxyphosphoribosylaminopyrimidine deaminase/5-amino-6-(5-phosphoribosylamino)uracil reductase RibD [Thermodesulfobacterium sp.]